MYRIPPLPHELEITHLKGSGPGGQNRNKRMTAVRVHHLPSGIVVTATERRSQAQNLAAAMERLEEKLHRLMHRDPKRIPTKQSRAGIKRRLEGKRTRSQTKKSRQTRWSGDD